MAFPFKTCRSSSSKSLQEAPLLVRASLVGASTAMMTPLFPVIGLNYLVFRHLPSIPGRSKFELESFPRISRFWGLAAIKFILTKTALAGSTNFESAMTFVWNGLEIFSLWSGILALSHFSQITLLDQLRFPVSVTKILKFSSKKPAMKVSHFSRFPSNLSLDIFLWFSKWPTKSTILLLLNPQKSFHDFLKATRMLLVMCFSAPL